MLPVITSCRGSAPRIPCSVPLSWRYTGWDTVWAWLYDCPWLLFFSSIYLVGENSLYHRQDRTVLVVSRGHSVHPIVAFRVWSGEGVAFESTSGAGLIGKPSRLTAGSLCSFKRRCLCMGSAESAFNSIPSGCQGANRTVTVSWRQTAEAER